MVAEHRIAGPPRITPFVGAVILVNGAVFVLLRVLSAISYDTFELAGDAIYLTPSLVLRGWVWQIITHAFAHFDFLHIFLNMAILYIFGCRIENALGSRGFARLYLFGALGSGALCVLVPFIPGLSASGDSFEVRVLGASGAIFAVCIAYACMFPNDIIYVFLLVPMRAKWAAWLFVGVAFLGLISARTGIANQAHLGGALFGYIYYKWRIEARPPPGPGLFGRRKRRTGSYIDERFREIAKDL